MRDEEYDHDKRQWWEEEQAEESEQSAEIQPDTNAVWLGQHLVGALCESQIVAHQLVFSSDIGSIQLEIKCRFSLVTASESLTAVAAAKTLIPLARNGPITVHFRRVNCVLVVN